MTKSLMPNSLMGNQRDCSRAFAFAGGPCDSPVVLMRVAGLSYQVVDQAQDVLHNLRIHGEA